MINTNDLKMYNQNFEQKYNVIIQNLLDDRNKIAWSINVRLVKGSELQTLHTFAGHIRLFKTLEFCLNFVYDHCDNAKSVNIVFSRNKKRKRIINVVDDPLKLN